MHTKVDDHNVQKCVSNVQKFQIADVVTVAGSGGLRTGLHSMPDEAVDKGG